MIKKLFFVSRPISWLNTAYPFAAGYLVSGGTIDATFIIATLFFLAPYNLVMYGVNDVYDYESDILNPRKGGIEGMREQRAFHPTILRAALISSIPFVVLLLITHALFSDITLLVLLFFVIAYSIKSLRFKEKPILDSITSSIHFVGPLVYALTLTHISVGSLGILIAFFLWGMASHAFGAVQDIIPDRKGNLHSIATVFGATKTVWFSFILYLIASSIMFHYRFPIYITGIIGVIYAANIVRYLGVSDEDSSKTNRAWKRFIYLNLFSGFIVTILLIATHISIR